MKQIALHLRKKEKRYTWIVVVSCFAFLALLVPARGQDFRASITGQVADSSGAVIPGASVTAVNVDTQLTYPTKADKEGVYSLLYLLPGHYTVKITAQSFQTMVYNNVHLNSGQKLGLNVTLMPGAVAQQVVVKAGAVDLDTVSASTGGVLDQMKVANMPGTGGLAWEDMVFTEGITLSSNAPFGTTPRARQNDANVAGVTHAQSMYYLNGAPDSDQGVWFFVPSQTSIAQLQAFVMPYDAQYGRTAGGVFSANVSGGANGGLFNPNVNGGASPYHGSVYDYLGNSFVNANSWSDGLTGSPKGRSNRNTYGAESGGPIRKNKTFYYASFEAFRQLNGTLSRDTVPPTAWLNGDFTGSGYTIYDPLSTYCAKPAAGGGCTTYARKPFPNDIIPTARMSPIGKAILALYPSPNVSSGFTNNYLVAGDTTYAYTQYIGRVDQSFSDNTRMYGMFALQDDSENTYGNGFNNAAQTTVVPTDRYFIAILDLTHILSPSKVLDLKASYGHDNNRSLNGLALQKNFLASNLGFNMPLVPTTPKQNIAPVINISGMTSLIGNTNPGNGTVNADFTGSITQLIGLHNLHYGAEFLDIQNYPTGFLGNPNGTFTFSDVYTRGNPLKAVTGQGNEVADTLLGYPASGSVGWDEPTFLTTHYYGLFIQDDFKVLPTLTLNLGLRWDVYKSPRDRQNRINGGFCFTCVNPYTAQVNYGVAPGLQNPLLGGLQFAGVAGVSNTPFRVRWDDWQPRFGFSWAVLPNTVIRGGYGVYNSWEDLSVGTTGFSQNTPYVASLDGNLTPDENLNSGTPYPTGAIEPTGAAAGLETDAGNGFSYYDPNRGIPMTQHWSFGIQQKIPGALFLDVEYLGTYVHGLPVSTQMNVISTAQQQACYASGAVCNTNVPNPFFGVLARNTSMGASATIPSWELERPYPLFGTVLDANAPSGVSRFNSLNVRVERTLVNLDFVVNYQYSNWMDKNSYLNNGTFRDSSLWKGLDPDDRRNYVDANIVYPIPGTRKKGVLGFLANGWLTDSLLVWGTGFPLPLPSANFTCSSLAPAGGQTRAHWFNNDESCWTDLNTWQPRTTPLSIGSLRQPQFLLWNQAFHKQFALPREGMFLQFRMEAQDAPNHPTFGAPSLDNATPPAFSPTTSWTGFGTLPAGQNNNPRALLSSLRLIF
jgi:Carboxypeptidase regulatory-like domain